jgi:hypothetical protein
MRKETVSAIRLLRPGKSGGIWCRVRALINQGKNEPRERRNDLLGWPVTSHVESFAGGAGAVAGPVVPLQIVEQRNALFEPFQILAHVGHRSPWPKLRTLGASSQAKMVGK